MEGYWVTHDDAGAVQRDGIAMLRAGELLGGDREYVWRGTYEEEGAKVYARIRITPFVTREEEETMARDKPMILSLEGTCTDDFARLDGHPDEREDLVFHVEMRKCRGRLAGQTSALRDAP
ncbi:MAG TPA: GrlR family regulatory protein [Acidobacteriaceae bacterium]|nr:GrlR family regulatory protein [Acidobacteriaceae bacterium]